MSLEFSLWCTKKFPLPLGNWNLAVPKGGVVLINSSMLIVTEPMGSGTSTSWSTTSKRHLCAKTGYKIRQYLKETKVKVRQVLYLFRVGDKVESEAFRKDGKVIILHFRCFPALHPVWAGGGAHDCDDCVTGGKLVTSGQVTAREPGHYHIN